MENIIIGLLSNPVFSGYLDLIFLCCAVYFFVKINTLDEKLVHFEYEQKDFEIYGIIVIDLKRRW